MSTSLAKSKIVRESINAARAVGISDERIRHELLSVRGAKAADVDAVMRAAKKKPGEGKRDGDAKPAKTAPDEIENEKDFDEIPESSTDSMPGSVSEIEPGQFFQPIDELPVDDEILGPQGPMKRSPIPSDPLFVPAPGKKRKALSLSKMSTETRAMLKVGAAAARLSLREYAKRLRSVPTSHASAVKSFGTDPRKRSRDAKRAELAELKRSCKQAVETSARNLGLK